MRKRGRLAITVIGLVQPSVGVFFSAFVGLVSAAFGAGDDVLGVGGGGGDGLGSGRLVRWGDEDRKGLGLGLGLGLRFISLSTFSGLFDYH